MNCKKGELAIIIDGPASGAIVQCLSRYDGPWTDPKTGLQIPFGVLLGWNLDRELEARNARFQSQRADKYLRPIRPGETPAQSIEAMRLITHIPKEIA